MFVKQQDSPGRPPNLESRGTQPCLQKTWHPEEHGCKQILPTHSQATSFLPLVCASSSACTVWHLCRSARWLQKAHIHQDAHWAHIPAAGPQRTNAFCSNQGCANTLEEGFSISLSISLSLSHTHTHTRTHTHANSAGCLSLHDLTFIPTLAHGHQPAPLINSKISG